MRATEAAYDGDDRNFDAMLQRFDLDDPVLWDIARIVRDADIGDVPDDVPDVSRLGVLLRSHATANSEREAPLVTDALFDGLYEYRRWTLTSGWQ